MTFIWSTFTKSSSNNVDWWRTIPRISVRNLDVNCAEVLWDKPTDASRVLISHYQVFFNQVSYKPNISPDTNRILARGLCAGRTYEITVMVYPNDNKFLPQQSNIVVSLGLEQHILQFWINKYFFAKVFTCSNVASTGGPVISLKSNSKNNEIMLQWLPIDSDLCSIDYYQLILNNERRELVSKREKRKQLFFVSVFCVPDLHCGASGFQSFS